MTVVVTSEGSVEEALLVLKSVITGEVAEALLVVLASVMMGEDVEALLVLGSEITTDEPVITDELAAVEEAVLEMELLVYLALEVEMLTILLDPVDRGMLEELTTLLDPVDRRMLEELTMLEEPVDRGMLLELVEEIRVGPTIELDTLDRVVVKPVVRGMLKLERVVVVEAIVDELLLRIDEDEITEELELELELEMVAEDERDVVVVALADLEELEDRLLDEDEVIEELELMIVDE